MNPTEPPEPHHEIRVACYSGYQYPERPISFTWQGECLRVQEIEARWLEPQGRLFRVRTEGGRSFELCYSPHRDRWSARELPRAKGIQ